MSKSSEREQEDGKVRTMGAKDRFYYLRAWNGMNASGWFRALSRNRFAVSPGKLPMVLVMMPVCLGNSVLAMIQALFYQKKISQTALIDDPIFVIGHWRSGTTLLHELLVCDPRHTSPDTYTCFAPNHFLLTEWLLSRLLGFMVPSQRPMDNMPIRWEYPQEDEFAMANMGVPTPYLTLLFPNKPPQYPEYVDLRDLSQEDRQRWQQKLLWFLRCLTLRDPKRIVLKTPLHTCRVRALLELFPNARFVHITRDPFVIFPSMIHTWKRLYKYQGAQAPRCEGLEEYVLSTFEHMYKVFDEDVKLIPPGRFCEVRYDQLVKDPVGQIQSVYDGLGIGEFEEARAVIAKRVENMAEYKTNRYELAESQSRAISERWAPYIHKYGPW